MADVHVTFFSPHSIGGTAVYPRKSRKSEKLTSSGASSRTTATALTNEFARVEVEAGGSICILAGPSATAAAGTDGGYGTCSAIDIGPLVAGDHIAVIDV